MPQSKEQHTCYMRDYRKRKAKYKIEKSIDNQVKRIKQQPIKRKREKSIWDDDFGKEPSENLEPQYYQTEKKSLGGCNLWHSNSESPQPKTSIQYKLRQLFPNRTE